MEIERKYKTLLEKNKINTPLRLAHFFAQLDHESICFSVMNENLNYSSRGLMSTFPRHFDWNLALKYHRQPEKIANRVYANRMGNGNYDSGDGWKYRGRGYIQLTGKNNYKSLSENTGIDYVNNPDLLLNEVDAMVSACFFWNRNNINKHADNDDIRMVTKAVNGGYNGIKDREEKLKKYKKIFT